MATAKAPTPAQIDALVDRYADAKSVADAAKAAFDVMKEKETALKAELTAMVEQYGMRHTAKSKRLLGIHNMATTTTSTRTTIDDAAVEKFRGYLEKQKLVELSGRFFVAQTTYTLVESPDEVLKTLSLGARLRDRLTLLVKSCFRIQTYTPSLKVETVQARAA